MTHRHPHAALALVTVLAALLPGTARASKADAFEGKIQPVSGQLYRKAGRLELTLGGGRSLNDAFFRKTVGDVKLGWHLTESWSVSAHLALGSASPTNSTTVCPSDEGCRPATEEELRQVPGRVTSLRGVEVEWAPIYGKLNAFSEKVAHVDLGVMAGLDQILHDEVLLRADAQAGVEPKAVTALGFHVGIGARVFVTEFLAVRLALKDYVYPVTVPNGDAGPNGKDWQNQLFSEVGISVFFPFSNRRLP